jgi:hypothetical protein
MEKVVEVAEVEHLHANANLVQEMSLDAGAIIMMTHLVGEIILVIPVQLSVKVMEQVILRSTSLHVMDLVEFINYREGHFFPV